MRKNLESQLRDAETYAEKVKAELYSTVGKISTLKEILKNEVKPTKGE